MSPREKFLYIVLFFTYSCINGILRQKIIKKDIPRCVISFVPSVLKYLCALAYANTRVYYDRRVVFTSFPIFVSSLIYLIAYKGVSAVTMAINAPSRILFTYVITRLLYDKVYGWDKIAGMLTISMGILISNSDLSAHASDEMVCVLLFLFGNFLNAVGLIYFDRQLRHHIVHFWDYMYTYSFTLLIFNILLFPIELLYLKEKNVFVYLNDIGLQISFITHTIEMIAYAYISIELDPLQRNFLSIAIKITTTVVNTLIFKDERRITKFISCSLTYLGILIYENKALKGVLVKKSPKK